MGEAKKSEAAWCVCYSLKHLNYVTSIYVSLYAYYPSSVHVFATILPKLFNVYYKHIDNQNIHYRFLEVNISYLKFDAHNLSK